MSVKVKICGIRNLEAAQVAVDAGADFLGFNLVPKSRRYIKPEMVKEIISQIKGKVEIVGVFQNEKVHTVNKIASILGLDFVQLHGDEDNEYISRVGVSIIKSITLDSEINNINAHYLLVDRVERGEGEMVNFKKAAKLAAVSPIFYAGGLNPTNVASVIRKVRPFAVDVAGGIETNGHQDIEKIKLFIKNTKGVML